MLTQESVLTIGSFVCWSGNDRIIRIGDILYREDNESNTLRKLEEEEVAQLFDGEEYDYRTEGEDADPIQFYDPELGTDYLS